MVDEILQETISNLTPNIQIVSEENVNEIKKFDNKFIHIKDKSHHILKYGIYEFVVFENFINIFWSRVH